VNASRPSNRIAGIASNGPPSHQASKSSNWRRRSTDASEEVSAKWAQVVVVALAPCAGPHRGLARSLVSGFAALHDARVVAAAGTLRASLIVTGLAAILLTPAAGAVPPSWPRYVDARNGFELRLPPGWKAGTSFLTTHAYAVLRRRLPADARDYAAMLHSAYRHGVLFIAVESSTISLEHALRVDGGSYGLFPTIFVVQGPRGGGVPAAFHDFVVPVAWAGGSLTPASNCGRTFGRLVICDDVYQAAWGDLYVDFAPIPHAPPGRAPLVAGFARGQLLEPNGGLLADPATPVWETVRSIIGYR
jgi:hypothetical protein